MVWVIGWLCSYPENKRYCVIVDMLLSFEGFLWCAVLQAAEVQTLWLVRQCFLGMRYYRWQRFKPFGLVSVHTEASFNVQCYRWCRFKPCGLISACLKVLISASGRGSNPLGCQMGFIWLLFLWIGTGSNPLGLQLVWKLECVGSNPVAWVDVFWGFLLRAQALSHV